MIKLFRQFRKRLLTENKVSKYLLYAIGEILLVVIGILLALQINSWNQDRQNRIDEQKYLLRLEQDLETDLKSIQEVRGNYETRLILGLKVLDSIGTNFGDVIRNWPHFEKMIENDTESDRWSSNNMGEDLFAILVVSQLAPARVTFDELQSTGKISLIQDDSLRTELQYHYPVLEKTLVFQEAIIFDVLRSYRQAMFINQISTLNQESYHILPNSLSDPEQLTTAIENYLRISSNFLSEIYYKQDSHYSNTFKLLERVKLQIAKN